MTLHIPVEAKTVLSQTVSMRTKTVGFGGSGWVMSILFTKWGSEFSNLADGAVNSPLSAFWMCKIRCQWLSPPSPEALRWLCHLHCCGAYRSNAVREKNKQRSRMKAQCKPFRSMNMFFSSHDMSRQHLGLYPFFRLIKQRNWNWKDAWRFMIWIVTCLWKPCGLCVKQNKRGVQRWRSEWVSLPDSD